MPLTDGDRRTLAALGQQLGRQALEDDRDSGQGRYDPRLAPQVRPIRRLTPPRHTSRWGVLALTQAIEAWSVQMARETCTWGYDRIVGALRNVGYTISDQTVGNILKRHGIPPAPERQKTMRWSEFIRIHMEVLGATPSFRARCGVG